MQDAEFGSSFSESPARNLNKKEIAVRLILLRLG